MFNKCLRSIHLSGLLVILIQFICVICLLNSAAALTIDEFEGAGEVVSNTTDTATNLIQTGDMIGGTRQIQTTRISGDLNMSLVTEGGLLSHVQDPVTKGTSRVIWDGDSNESGITATGLGGINLLQDYATPDPANDGLVLKVFSVDASVPIRVKITVYTNDLKISRITRDLTTPINWPEYTEPRDIIFLFKDSTCLSYYFRHCSPTALSIGIHPQAIALYSLF